MKKELKLMINIIKATPKIKQKIYYSVIAVFLGIISDICSASYNNAGGLIALNGAIILYQCIMVVSGSDIVQSSSAAKKLQTVYPFFILLPAQIIVFTLLSIYRVYLASKPMNDMTQPKNYAVQCEHILIISLVFFVTMICEIIMHKFYVFGIITFVILVVPLILYSDSNALISNFFSSITLTDSILSGLLIIIAGSLLAILTANLLYNHPIADQIIKLNNKA